MLELPQKEYTQINRVDRNLLERSREMKKYILFLLSLVIVFYIYGCQPPKTEPVMPVKIADGDVDPANWGKAYPIEYDLWKKTAEPTAAGKSKYKRGFNADGVTYDKLSEFPYLALLFNGWGFGVEYNEPRGHAYMIKDQLGVAEERLKAGGVCLTCKTPYAPKLEKELGPDYYSKPWTEVYAMIPKEHQDLGVACIDCHNNKDMSLRISRASTLTQALGFMGIDPAKITRQQMRSLVCAQCHVTYDIMKDKDMKSVGLYFPWQGSKFGNITIENIIKQIRSDPSVGEWTQKVTGFKLGFIRHPEFELFSNNSVHWKAGAACADCHMPYTKVGVYKVSDHWVTSPLKNDMKACIQCHAEPTDWLREQVYAIQDRTVSLMLRAGYANATVAKLFEKVHEAQAAGKNIDKTLYDSAKDYYEEAFYRAVFVGAENSVGFHNPAETLRVLGDSVAFATKAEGLLRQALTKAGVDVPLIINLELNKYLDARGKKKLKFNQQIVINDPYGIEEKFLTVKQTK